MTQVDRVHEYLKLHGTITSLQAVVDLGVIHLPRRVLDLKQSGVPISGKFVKVQNRFNEVCVVKEYRLELPTL